MSLKSSELFWKVIAAYHERYIGLEFAMIALGIVLTGLTYVKPTPIVRTAMRLYLAASFGWMAFAFFWGLDQSPLSQFFVGPLFLVIAAAFLADVFFQRISFALPSAGAHRFATFALFALVLLYPLLSFALGHRYPRLSTPFLPCPLTVFALAMVCAALPQTDRKVYVLLLVWAVMALPKVFGLFDVKEDSTLFAAGLYALVRLVPRWKASGSATLIPLRTRIRRTT